MRRNKSGGGFSHFISALLGAVIGGFVIYFLLGGAASKDNKIAESDNNPKQQIESKENKESTKKDININADDSIESVVVKKSIDSVVGINTISEVTQNTFVGQQSGYVEGIGSGSIVTEDGYIVTNSHVVSNGDVTQINVLFSNGETSEAAVSYTHLTLPTILLV